MSNEQWLIYLYGIYPDGGWITLWALLTLATAVTFVILVWIRYDIYRSVIEDSDNYYTNSLWYKLGKWKIGIPIILALLIFLSNLVPDKKTFLLLVAAPTIVQAIESPDGKLNKLNALFDKALDKADSYIEGK